MKIAHSKISGFSIIELAVATIVGALAFITLFYVSFSMQNSVGLNQGILGITEKSRLALNHISDDTRKAKRVIPSYGSYATDNDTLVLEVPSINSAGNIINPDTTFDIIIYTPDPSNSSILLRVVDANPSSARNDITESVASDISILLFSSGGISLSSVSDKNAIQTLSAKIVTSKNIAGSIRSNEVSASISLRNRHKGL